MVSEGTVLTQRRKYRPGYSASSGLPTFDEGIAVRAGAPATERWGRGATSGALSFMAQPVATDADGAVVTHIPGTGAELQRLRRENAELRVELEETEAERDAYLDALVNQQFHIVDGYVASVWPAGDGTYIASCPTLHASVQAPSAEEAQRLLPEAVRAAREGREHFGRAVPPRDVDR